ncbi:MAG: hypothetical protein LAO20_04345 [Acidobacteriia bacterium]|nr:hypothetical protein [Terriglobia bacterium]
MANDHKNEDTSSTKDTSLKLSEASGNAATPKRSAPDGGRVPYVVSMYHLLILGSVIFLALKFQHHAIPSDDWFDEIYALLGGGLGGTVTASRWVVWAVRHGEYDARRLLWQLSTPVYSAALAWIGLVATRGGLLVVSNSAPTKEPNFTYFVLAFSFLVGFASEAFLKRLILAAQTLFGEHREESRQIDLEGDRDRIESSRTKESD